MTDRPALRIRGDITRLKARAIDLDALREPPTPRKHVRVRAPLTERDRIRNRALRDLARNHRTDRIEQMTLNTYRKH